MNRLLLNRPRIAANRNRLRLVFSDPKVRFRYLIFLIVIGSMIYLLQRAGEWAVNFILYKNHLAFVPPQMLIELLMSFICAMVLLTAGVNAFGTLFLARDLELVLSAPLRRGTFFCSKFFDVLFSSSWMSVVFCLPFFLALGSGYNAGVAYYAAVIFAMIAIFAIVSALAISIVTLFVRFVPLARGRWMLVAAAIGFGALVVYAAHILSPASGDTSYNSSVLRLVALVAKPGRAWLPSSWVAEFIGGQLIDSGRNPFLAFTMLGCSALLAIAISYLVVEIFYFRAYSFSKSLTQGATYNSLISQRRLLRWLTFLPAPQRALVIKDMKVFYRDVSHIVQLLLLLGIIALYLYNFSMIRSLDDLPIELRRWWASFLLTANICMGNFLITATCTRFVFPSVSLEGQSYLLLQASPLSIRQFLRTKFLFWLVPTSLAAAVILGAGARSLGNDGTIVAICMLFGMIVCYGVTALAIGLGAVFANFDWEQPGQLAASFGSLVFMVSSVILVSVNLSPVAWLLFMRSFSPAAMLADRDAFELQWLGMLLLTVVSLLLLNLFVARTALRMGERALQRRSA